MILANAFCLFFFLGEYLRAASSGRGEKPGRRGASGAPAGGWREAGGESAPRSEPGPVLANQAGPGSGDADEGPEPRLAGDAGGSGGRLNIRTGPADTHTHTHPRSITCQYSAHLPRNNGFELRQLKEKKISNS